MSRRALTIMAIALAVLAALAALFTIDDGRPAGRGELLLPGLKANLNDIDRVTVTGSGNAAIATLVRSGEGWTVEERNGYPADVGRIRKNLLALADAVIVEEKTSNPEFYARLGVDDVADPNARGLQLTLSGTGNDAALIIGDTDAGTTYVRRVGEATSWMVTGSFDLSRLTAAWLDRSLLDIAADRIREVAIAHPGGETVRVRKADGDDGFTVADIPKGRELTGPWVAGNIAGALANLSLDEVETREILDQESGKPVVTTFSAVDGLIVETSAWRVADGTRVTFTASTTEDAGEGIATEAAAINDRLGVHVYTLPAFKVEYLTRRMQDLLAPAG